VWFEVVGQDADTMRSYYGDPSGWSFDVMPGMDYGLTPSAETALPGGVGEARSTAG
jgi:predicted enzyme related to lactoylglutathione lyase